MVGVVLKICENLESPAYGLPRQRHRRARRQKQRAARGILVLIEGCILLVYVERCFFSQELSHAAQPTLEKHAPTLERSMHHCSLLSLSRILLSLSLDSIEALRLEQGERKMLTLSETLCPPVRRPRTEHAC